MKPLCMVCEPKMRAKIDTMRRRRAELTVAAFVELRNELAAWANEHLCKGCNSDPPRS